MIVQLSDLVSEIESHGADLAPRILLRGFQLKVWERIPIAGSDQFMTRSRCLWYNPNELTQAIRVYRRVRQHAFTRDASLVVRFSELPSHRRYRMLITLAEEDRTPIDRFNI